MNLQNIPAIYPEGAAAQQQAAAMAQAAQAQQIAGMAKPVPQRQAGMPVSHRPMRQAGRQLRSTTQLQRWSRPVRRCVSHAWTRKARSSCP